MRKSEQRFYKDLHFINSSSFIDCCRAENPKHFTRNRKMPLPHLLVSILSRKGRTLYMELRELNKKFKIQNGISKPGYLKQRMKLNPLAFKILALHHAQTFYQDPESIKGWKGYLILAVDGTSLNVPLTAENVQTYGDTAKHGRRERPQIGLSCLFDVKNRMLIDMNTGPCKINERQEAIVHIDQAANVIGNRESIYLFDRGYPSGEFFLDLLDRKKQFLARLGSVSFKREQQSMDCDDCDINILFDKTRYKACKKETSSQRLKEAGAIRLRFVRIWLENGDCEYLVTNLDRKEFCTEEIGSLYRMRWGIETVFDDLKNKLQIENFTGQKPVIMEQDIYATIYLSNIINDILLESSSELKKTTSGKYEMQINRGLAIGIIKEELFHLLMEENLKKKQEIMDAILNEVKKNLLPVRKNRKYGRSCGKLASNYSNTRKRYF